jgi:hypothetical protein
MAVAANPPARLGLNAPASRRPAAEGSDGGGGVAGGLIRACVQYFSTYETARLRLRTVLRGQPCDNMDTLRVGPTIHFEKMVLPWEKHQLD